jgi:hypothetical protein
MITAAPAAQIVDTFAAPEVRATNDGTDLLQISAALQSFNPQLERFAAARENALQTQQNNQAVTDFQSGMYKNMKDLKAAFDAGEIDQKAMPYRALMLKKLVASEDARQRVNQIRKAYLEDTTGLKSADTEQVSQWIDQQLTGVTDELDGWSARFMSESLLAGRSQLLAEHQSISERKIQAKNEDDLTLGISREVGKGDLKGVMSVIEAGELSGFTSVELRKAALKAVLETAEASGDIDNLEETLGAIQIGGASLLETVGPGVERLRNAVEERVNARKDREYRDTQRVMEQAGNKALLAVTRENIAANREGRPPKPLNEIGVDESELDPKFLAHLLSVQYNAAKNEVGEVVDKMVLDAFATVHTAKAKLPQAYSALIVEVSRAFPDHASRAASMFTNLTDSWTRSQYVRVDDPETALNLGKAARDQSVPAAEFLAMVVSATDKGQLTQDTQSRLITAKVSSSEGRNSMAGQAYQTQTGRISDTIKMAVALDGRYRTFDDMSGKEVLSVDGQKVMTDLIYQGDRQLQEWIAQHPDATAADIHTQGEQILNGLTKQFAGVPVEVIQQKTADVETAQHVVNSTKQVIEGWGVAPSNGTVLSKGDLVIRSADGTEAPLPPGVSPVLFNSVYELETKGVRVAQSMGAQSPDDTAKFFAGQLSAMKAAPNTHEQVRRGLIRQMYGNEVGDAYVNSTRGIRKTIGTLEGIIERQRAAWDTLVSSGKLGGRSSESGVWQFYPDAYNGLTDLTERLGADVDIYSIASIPSRNFAHNFDVAVGADKPALSGGYIVLDRRHINQMQKDLDALKKLHRAIEGVDLSAVKKFNEALMSTGLAREVYVVANGQSDVDVYAPTTQEQINALLGSVAKGD